MPRRSVRSVVWVGLLAAIAVSFWWFQLFAPAYETPYQANLLNVDHYTANYPAATGVVRQITEGRVPLWNPYQMAGFPMLATVVVGALYPLNFLYLMLPIEWAIEATMVLHLFLAGLFTFAYLRTLSLAAPAAAAGGLVYMLSGFLAGQAVWFTCSMSATVWLPVLLMGLERLARAARRPDVGGVALIAIATAMPVLAGWLQTWVYSMYAAAVYTALHAARLAYRQGLGSSLRFAAAAAVGLVLGLGLAAPQLLPAFELQGLGPRAPGGLSLDQILLFGPYSPTRLAMDALQIEPGAPRMPYVGVLSLLLIPASLLAIGRIPIVAWWILGVFSSLVALTVATSFFELFLALPTAGWFRFPHRILVLAAFTSACLVAVGLDAAGRRPRKGFLGRSLLGGLLVVAIAALTVAWDSVPTPTRSYVVAGSAGVLLLLFSPWRWLRIPMAALLAFVLVGEMFRGSVNVVPHPAHALAPLRVHDEVWTFIREHQGYGRTYVHAPQTFDFSVTPKQATLNRYYSVADYEPLNLQRFERFYDLLGGGERKTPFSGVLAWDPALPNADLISLLGVRFIVVHQLNRPFWQGIAALDRGWQQAYRADGKDGRTGWSVLEHVDPFPRAYTTGHWIPAGDEAEAFERLTSADFDPRRSIVLEGVAGEAKPLSGSDAIVPAEIVEYEPTRVVLAVRATRPGYAVLSDTFYPGWRAEVDGRATPILRANYLFRAVPIEAGEHRIVFRYEPLSFRLGASAWAASGALLVGAGLGARRRRRRLPPPAAAGPSEPRPEPTGNP